MQAFKTLTSKSVVIPASNIDTDQIIPARFLKGTDKAGLGEKLFNDWRYLADGSPNPDFVLNKPESQGAQILIAGDNFGCGSSREHAPWALFDYGFRAVVSTTIADIFRNNALKNGLLPVVVDEEFHAHLTAHAGAEITIDLERREITAADGRRFQFEVELFARFCMLNGKDQLDFLLDQSPQITRYEEAFA